MAGSEFAILAPVPLEHLRSGEAVADAEGFVAFGSKDWELFEKIDSLREGRRVPVLLVASHDNRPLVSTDRAGWFGWYCGHVRSRGGAHPQGMRHRPPTTAANPGDNVGHWAVFWHVEGLRELPKDLQPKLSDLKSLATDKQRRDAVPRRPALIELAPELANEE